MLQIESPIDLGLILRAGQVFCWEFVPESEEWVGVIDSSVFRLKQQGSGISFTYQSDSLDDNAAIDRLRDFFQLETDLPNLRAQWSKYDKAFTSEVFAGLHICRQDPLECLISFIVSANNNIKRIDQNLRSIRKTFGTCIDDQAELYAFPTTDELAKATAEQLRSLGLGYRAEYIVKTVSMLSQPGMFGDLYKLRDEEDTQVAREFLMQFQGVGRKVADCVMLYSLDFPSVAPVDTHMFQIAQRIFSKTLKKDNAMHDTIQRLMIDRFGPMAGWAHCYLFAADLKPSPPEPAKRSRKTPVDADCSTAASSPV